MQLKLDIKDIRVTIGKQTVLDGVSASASGGMFVACIGPNGAGKSSLLRAIAGVLPVTEGSLLLNGEAVQHLQTHIRARSVTLVPQFTPMPAGFTVREVVEMGRYSFRPWYARETAQDRAVVAAALAQCEVQEFADQYADRLSGGEQQRVAVARAIAQEPQVLLLDESTAHLDLHHQAALVRIARALTQTGVLVIAAMHDLNLAAATADSILLLDRGTLVAAGPPAVVMEQATLERVYRTALVTYQRADGALPFFALPTVSS